MAHLSNSSWRAKAACMAVASCSQSLVEPSMSVNRKVTVPVGGLATTLMSSLLPSRGNYISAAFSGPSVYPPKLRPVAEDSYGPCATLIEAPRSSLSFRSEVNALVDTPALAPSVFSADVLLQCTGELPKGFFDR